MSRVSSERSLEASIKWLKACEYTSAAAVLFGVILDDTTWLSFIFGQAAFWSWLKERRVGGAFIAIGIALETLFSMLISGREAKLQSLSAGRRAEAERQTVEALRLLEQEKLARVKLEEIITRRTISRTLSVVEQTSMSEKLTEFAGVKYTVLASDPSDSGISEHVFFAKQLDRVLLAAGWIGEPLQPSFKTKAGQGVTIFVKGNTGKAGYALMMGLNTLYIDVQVVFNEDEGEFPLIVFVGFR